MKRCPKCSFLYLESDQLCDLDQTPLIADTFGTDAGVAQPLEQKAVNLSLTAAVHQRKPSMKTLSAAIVAGLVISLMLLLSYQRMRPTLLASQGSTTSQAQASRVPEVAQQALNEASKAALAQQESESAVSPDDSTSPSAEPNSSSTAKTTPNTRPDSVNLRVSAKPVSTGDAANPGRGPVTIRLTDGATLQAEEVWRTKAGIWYRRKGIVTFLKPNRVRAISK